MPPFGRDSGHGGALVLIAAGGGTYHVVVGPVPSASVTGAPKLVLHDLASLTAAHACARGVSSGK